MTFLSPFTSHFDRAGMDELASKTVAAAKAGDMKTLNEAIKNLTCLASIEGDNDAFTYLAVADKAREHIMAAGVFAQPTLQHK